MPSDQYRHLDPGFAARSRGNSDAPIQILADKAQPPDRRGVARNFYTYDDEGQIKSWNRQLGATSSGRWFEYDFAGQLLNARNASEPVSATQVNNYNYDNAGNRESDDNFNPQGPLGNGTTHGYTLNNLNQIESITTLEGPFATIPVYLSYDLAGNLLDDGEGKTFEWDAANRLRAINYGSQRSEFTYDGLSRRVKIVEKTGSTVLQGTAV